MFDVARGILFFKVIWNLKKCCKLSAARVENRGRGFRSARVREVAKGAQWFHQDGRREGRKHASG